ncbi:hypothetical protein Tco_0652961 [Tanacetum coccineum]|uniref:Uncharacterized protein n=1 Tax=Tanacetum coccineum TaxID=301880 RepID=A0ABQ4WZ92_9ASTR
MNQSQVNKVRATPNSPYLSQIWTFAIQREIETNLAIGRQLMGVVRELQASLNRRQALINYGNQLKDNKMTNVLFFIEMQDKEMAVMRDLLLKINEALKRPVEKT